MYCACHMKGSRGQTAATSAAAPPGGSVYCACHIKGSRGPAAATRAAAPPGGSVYIAPATRKAAAAQRRPRAPQFLLEALCTAPATQKAAAAQRRPRAPQCHTKGSRGPAAATRAAAPPGSSVYLRLSHERQPRPSGDHARRSSSRRLCATPATRKAAAAQQRPRAPQLLLEALCTAPATRKAAAAHCGHARLISSRRLCVLRLPHERQPRPSGGHATPQLVQEALCTAPTTRKVAAAQRRPHAQQFLQEALCTAPATPKAARKLSVLRLPRE